MITAEPASDMMRQHEPYIGDGHSRSSPRIAYLLSQYPARSHTFLLNEVLGLRLLGLGIEVASINAPDRPLSDLPDREAVEARSTFYIKQTGRIRALFSLLSTMAFEPRVIARGVRFIRHLPVLSFRQRLFWLFYLAEAILLGRWMRQRNLPHLHVHFGGAVASVGMLTSVAWRLPYSLTIHGPEELLDPAGYQMPAKLAQASFVICISSFCQSQLREITPAAHWPKLSVIRLGVDPKLLSPERMASRAPHAPPTILCVGRLVPEKGHRVLLQALAVLQARGVPFRAELIGTGPLEADLYRLVKELGLQDHVLFTSGLSHAETLAHVRSADIFALASFAEGVPVALMEAMSLSVPCVSTTIAGIPELIHSGESGLLVPPGDVEALTHALETLMEGDFLRRGLGSAGRRRILADYNLPLNLERLAQHFRERLAEPGSGTPPIQTPFAMRPATGNQG